MMAKLIIACYLQAINTQEAVFDWYNKSFYNNLRQTVEDILRPGFNREIATFNSVVECYRASYNLVGSSAKTFIVKECLQAFPCRDIPSHA